ncbi:amidase signature domain-containing protein [Gaertneriomyces semiglobifer]|nr:amidase signature domain-containing protein [Gaertneriomyces semiglobifer]
MSEPAVLAKPKRVAEKDANGYYLHSFSTPSATGWTLRILCYIFRSVGFVTGLTYKIANDSNLFYLRRHPIEGDPMPTYYPLIEPDAEQGSSQVADLDAIASSGLKLKNRIFRSVGDFYKAYKSRSVTPLEVANAVILALQSNNAAEGDLKAVIKWNEGDILKHAAESTERWKQGMELGVLDGVPVAVKDELDVKNYETGVGTSFLCNMPEDDAFCVANLRRAGALIIGKANMHEIGLDVTNCNPNSGTPRNPYNPAHFPGGSSGGSAAAVAAGLCPIAVGADGGGSVRVPASYCGVYGLKPTCGRISESGAFPLAPTVGVVGPIAATASDLAVAYALMSGPDEKDVNTLKQPSIALTKFGESTSLTGVKIGIYRDYFEDAHPEVVNACYAFLEKLRERGATIVDIVIPDLEALRVAHANTITSEMLSVVSKYPIKKFTYPTQMALTVVGNHITSADYIQAARVKTVGIQNLKNLFQQVDAIITPTAGITAPKIPKSVHAGLSDYTTSGKAMRFIFIANLLGIPGVSCPVGYNDAGLPIGLQFQAKWWNEELLLHLAHVSEDIFSAERRKPKMFHDLLAVAPSV